MFSLKGRRALITGASGGIGKGIAKCLVTQGMEVILSGTRKDILEEVRIYLQNMGGTAHVLPCDLNDQHRVDNLFEEAEQFGEIDTLINNAGVTKDNLSIRMSNEEWQKVIDINLTVSFKLCRSAIKAMMKRRFGRIINISSVVATMGNPGQTNYCASKAGLLGMSKALALEIASRCITVNCIAPGFIDSAMTDKLNDTQKQAILSTIPLKRTGHPEEIGGACAYLASQEAAYITGQTLHINGGLEMI